MWCTPGSPICDTVMGSGLWGGELVIYMNFCSFKQFLVDFIAYKLF